MDPADTPSHPWSSHHGHRPHRPPLPQGAGLHRRGVPRPGRAGRRAEGGQEGRGRGAAAAREEHRADLREDLDPYALRVRGRRRRPGRLHHLPGPLRLPDGPQGVGEGHRPGARPDVRRDRVPGRQPAGGRGAGRVRRGPGLQRAHRRLAPHPDAGRRADHDRAQREARHRSGLRLPRGRPLQHGQLLPDHRRPARPGHPDRRPRDVLAGPSVVAQAEKLAAVSGAKVTLTTDVTEGVRAPTSSPPTSGSRWGSPRRSGTNASPPSPRTP